MDLIDRWRSEYVYNKFTLVIPKGVAGWLTWLFPRKAGCGDATPWFYRITANGHPVTLSADTTFCAVCRLENLRKKELKSLAGAIPCAHCGEPIFLGSPVALAEWKGEEPENWPYPPTYVTCYVVVCMRCMSDEQMVFGHWGQNGVVPLLHLRVREKVAV